VVAFASTVGPFYREANPRLRPPVTIRILSGEGRLTGTLGEFPGTEIMAGGAARAMTVGPVVFGRRLHAWARGNRIAVANDDQYSIRVYDAAGKLLYVIRQTRAPVAPRPKTRKSHSLPDCVAATPPTTRWPGTSGHVRRAVQVHDPARLRWLGKRDLVAPIRPHGELWVRSIRSIPRKRGPGRPSIAGCLPGRLDLPPRSTLLEVGDVWVLLRTLDDLDVEHIQLYGLEPPS
jgi:hypothetical protein